AIQWMVSEQQFDHALARLSDLVAVGCHHHAFGDPSRACRLQLRHFLNPHQTHAARALQRQVGVVAERWNLDADGLAGLDQQAARWRRDHLAVDRNVYEFGSFSHLDPVLNLIRLALRFLYTFFNFPLAAVFSLLRARLSEYRQPYHRASLLKRTRPSLQVILKFFSELLH